MTEEESKQRNPKYASSKSTDSNFVAGNFDGLEDEDLAKLTKVSNMLS